MGAGALNRKTDASVVVGRGMLQPAREDTAMTSTPQKQARLPVAGLVVAAALAFLASGLGCIHVAPKVRLPLRAERYRIEVRMDPASHRLEGRAVLDLTRAEEWEVPDGQDAGSVYSARRGIEKTLFRITIVLAIIFIVLVLLTIAVGR